MRRPRLALLCAAVLGAGLVDAVARDLTTKTGETYHNITVNRVEPLGISITHTTGVAFLECPVLPDEMQREFGCTDQSYSAAKAAREQQDRALAEYQRQIAAQAAQQQAESNRRIAEAMEAAQHRQWGETAIQQRDYSDRGFSADRYSSRGYTGPKTMFVHGYTRRDGTYVHSYSRSAGRR